jgi:hypothetical protein
MNLKRGDALFAAQHEVQNLEPSEQRNFGFLEDRSSLERESIRRAIVLTALFALPVPRAGCAFVNVIVLATRTLRASGPAAQEQIRPARLLIGEQPVEISKRHLTDETRFGCFVIGHASENSAKQDGSQQSHNPLNFGGGLRWGSMSGSESL